MTTGAQMLLKNMLGVDPEKLIEDFKVQITTIGITVKQFDDRLQRMEKMLSFLCLEKGINVDTHTPLIEGNNSHDAPQS